MPMMMPARRNKFGARKTVFDGKTYDSAGEARRAAELKLLLRAGRIADLVEQPRFRLDVNGIHICDYIADFAYTEAETGKRVVEDFKSKATRTPVYRIKAKLARAIHGLIITEVN